ncbi:hypothetical protein HDU77_007230 [Chytriomyces hyalinus]|nr:hypothetical protein HDU77_007230 [Chytriomyces hyalinus]
MKSLANLWRENAVHKTMLRKLANLVEDGLVVAVEAVGDNIPEHPDTVNLHTGLVYGVLMAAFSYVPMLASSVSFTTSEAHCKIDLWAPIFSQAFKINQSWINSVWEQRHFIPRHGGSGSLVSDFAAVVGRSIIQISSVPVPAKISVDELQNIRFHLGYVSDGTIVIDEIHPEYHSDYGRIIY